MAAAASLLSHLSFLSWLLLLLPLPSLCQNSTNITLGSSLSTVQENPSWCSPSGEFAFGFYRHPGEDRFILAVWFNKIHERTVVWSAKVDRTLRRGSTVNLTNDGKLELYDNLGQISWNLTTTAVSAAIFDNGEFVLKGNNSRVWGTFDEPTDTILPTQKLVQNASLSSRLAENFYSNGKFRLRLDGDGNLKLYTANVPTGFMYDISPDVTGNDLTGFSYKNFTGMYNGHSVGSRSLGNGSELVFNETGHLGLLQSNGTISNLTLGNCSFPTSQFYHRATLDADGVFRHYVHRKAKTSSWMVVGSIPLDVCTTVTSYPGSGVCGFNSYCKLDENQRPKCECPTWYVYSNMSSSLDGCKPNFTAQTCYSDGLEGEKLQYEMEGMPNTTWVLVDYEDYSPVDERFCKNSCLDDCLCAVAVFEDGHCVKKKLPLSNGRAGPGIKAKALVKVPKSNSRLQEPPPSDFCKENKKQETLVLVGSTLLGSSFFVNFLFVSAISLAFYYSYHKKLLGLNQDASSSLLGLNLRSFTFKQLEEATKGYKEEIGRGAYGTVYKGVLATDSSKIVAVKRLEKVVQEGEREFKTEVSVIGQTHHQNLVRLLGFCDEGPHRLLVYEFMSNGSLASLLFSCNSRPSWRQRCQIAIGIARGLTYLHEECSTQIIHCDIKPQNILLDDRFVARIADFGLAKLLKTDQARTSTEIRGTPGYLAPEWFKNLSITVKVDVYSFGIMLLEIISCRKHLQVQMGHEDEMFLKDWACKCYREGRLEWLVKEDEEALKDRKVLERMVMVAIWCVQDDPSLRPSMKRAVRMLAGVVVIPVPMDPSFSVHRGES